MRSLVWIGLAGAVAMTGCEKPAAVAPAPEPPKAAPQPKPIKSWDPRDLNAMARASTPCGSLGFLEVLNEAEAIRRTGDAERRGKLLTVGKARFENKGTGGDDDLEAVDFAYLGVYGDSGVDAVMARYYEGGDVTLVDRRNGATIAMVELPIVSPDGRFFAAAMGSDYSGHQLQIVERTPKGWVKRADFGEAVSHSPCALQWRDSDTLTLRARWPTGVPDATDWAPELDEAWGPARVVRTGDAWRYEAPKR